MLQDIEVKETSNMGYGVYALNAFQPGYEIIDIAYGRVLTRDECEHVPQEIFINLIEKMRITTIL